MKAILQNKYHLQHTISFGGSSSVYLANKIGCKKKIAIKILEKNSSDYRALFDNEIQMLQKITHPNIIKLLDSNRQNDATRFMVMPWINGLPLYRFIPKTGIASKQALAIIDLICQPIIYLHNMGICHLDLKPSNILLPIHPEPINDLQIIDFANATNKQFIHQIKRLKNSNAFASNGYYHPRHYQNSNILCQQVDIFAIAAILLFMLTGKHPSTTSQDQSNNNKLCKKIFATITKAMSYPQSPYFKNINDFIGALHANS